MINITKKVIKIYGENNAHSIYGKVLSLFPYGELWGGAVGGEFPLNPLPKVG